jgi:hypothetical protein
VNVVWTKVGDGQRRLHTPLGLRMIDDFTGKAPVGAVRALLEMAGATPGTWLPVAHPATITPGGWLAYPGLGRTVDPGAKTKVRHRVAIVADDLLPLYGPSPIAGPVEFDVHPWDDLHPPASAATMRDVFLLPATGYAFPGEVLVARGRVVAGAPKQPVARALVTYANQERVLTDARGEFALPLRWAARGTTVQIDAADGGGRVGQVPVAIPGDLGKALEITIA